LTCPKCGGSLRIISFIDNPRVIEKILKHLKLWDPPERPPPPHRSTYRRPIGLEIAVPISQRLTEKITRIFPVFSAQ
jgi:hypothetical protein